MQGFSGDPYFKQAMLDIVEESGIKTIVETGTFKGQTTVGLAKMVDNVYTIEISEKYHAEVQPTLKPFSNIVSILGDGPKVLDEIIPELEGPVLFFLDSHWYKNPLLGELEAIAKHGIKPHIVIHDFKVPGKPDFGYDEYADQGITYEWDYVKNAVQKIYGDDFKMSYNAEAAGSKRGILFLAPELQPSEELANGDE